MENKKVLVVLISRDKPMQECYDSILAQHYTDYSLLLYAQRPDSFHLDPIKDKYLNCSLTRSKAREMALASDAELFLFVDDDVVLPPNALADLASHKKDIVGGWYKMVKSDKWVAGNVKDGELVNFTEVQKGLVETDMIGLGCALMTRDVLQDIYFKAGIKDVGSLLAGECFVFGEDAHRAGYKLFMDGAVICDHLSRN